MLTVRFKPLDPVQQDRIIWNHHDYEEQSIFAFNEADG